MNTNAKYVEKWVGYLEDVDRDMSRIAAEKLGKVGSKQAVPALVKALRNRPDEIRAAAARSLGDIGDSSAIKALSELMDDYDVLVAYAAIDALGRIGDDGALPALRRVLTKYKDERDNSLYLAACSALHQIGSSEAKRLLKLYGR